MRASVLLTCVALVALVALVVLTAGCDSIVEPENPIDPGTDTGGDTAGDTGTGEPCEDECGSIGETRCSGAIGLQVCEADAEGCRVWGEVSDCADPDASPCVDAACVNGVCGAVDTTAGCDDGLACTASDQCASGQCTGAPSNPACDDEVWCNGA
ncbi:MAG: hypothetical protein ACI9WU_003575, partial [Myxococcota bacterium]